MSDGLRKCMSEILICWLGAQRTGPVLGGPASAPANQQIWHAAWVFPPGSLEMVCLLNICFQKRVESRRKKTSSDKKAIPLSEEKGFILVCLVSKGRFWPFSNSTRWVCSTMLFEKLGRLGLQTEVSSRVHHSSPPSLRALCLTKKKKAGGGVNSDLVLWTE